MRDGGVLTLDAGPSQFCACGGRQGCNWDSGTCLSAEVCGADADCVSPLVCVNGTCAAKPECRSNADCPMGSSCNVNPTVLKCEANTCTLDSQCAAPRVCSTGDGTTPGYCVECRSVVDCTGNKVCLGNRCSEPPLCQSNADCTAPRVCNVDAGSVCQDLFVSPLSCIEASKTPGNPFYDPYEGVGNDFKVLPDGGVPPTLAAGTTVDTLCFSDNDWFQLPVAEGDGILWTPIPGVAPATASPASQAMNHRRRRQTDRPSRAAYGAARSSHGRRRRRLICA